MDDPLERRFSQRRATESRNHGEEHPATTPCLRGSVVRERERLLMRGHNHPGKQRGGERAGCAPERSLHGRSSRETIFTETGHGVTESRRRTSSNHSVSSWLRGSRKGKAADARAQPPRQAAWRRAGRLRARTKSSWTILSRDDFHRDGPRSHGVTEKNIQQPLRVFVAPWFAEGKGG